MAKNLQELINPFKSADSHTRTALMLEEVGLLSQKVGFDISEDEDSWYPLQTTIANAITGQLIVQKSTETRWDQTNDMLQRANDIEGIFKSIGEKDCLYTKEASEAHLAFTLSRATVSWLHKLAFPTYAQLTIHQVSNLSEQISNKSTNWWKNYDTEGLIRELDWIQKMTQAFSFNPVETINQRPQDILRLGHFFAAVVMLTDDLL